MNKEEISKLVLSNPDEAWRKIQSGELDTSKVVVNVLRTRAKDQFKMTDGQMEAAESTYWGSYLVERNISEMISILEKSSGNTDIVDDMLNRLSFGGKISLMNDRYNKTSQIKPFINMAWKINQLRNDMAHGRFNNLKYEGIDLSDRKGQFKFLIDLTTAFTKSASNISQKKN